jgi:hypothetical protein
MFSILESGRTEYIFFIRVVSLTTDNLVLGLARIMEITTHLSIWIAPENMVSNWSSKTSSNKRVLIRNCMMSDDGASLQPHALHSTINV